MLIPVEVNAIVDAPAGRVYAAWLDPALLGRWMFGPAVREETILRLELDARVGGRFSFLVRRGENEIEHAGRYLALDPPRRIVFTWGLPAFSAEEDEVTVTMEETPEGGTAVRLVHTIRPEFAEYAERTAAGWRHMLGCLGRELGGAGK